MKRLQIRGAELTGEEASIKAYTGYANFIVLYQAEHAMRDAVPIQEVVVELGSLKLSDRAKGIGCTHVAGRFRFCFDGPDIDGAEVLLIEVICFGIRFP